MNFIEHLVGFAPDGGSGTLELVLLFAPVILACVMLARRRSTRITPKNWRARGPMY